MTGDIYADFICNRCGEESPPIKLDYSFSCDGSIQIMADSGAEGLATEGWLTRKDERRDIPNWQKTEHLCDKCVAREKRRAEILKEAT